MTGDEPAQFIWTSESGQHLCVSVFSWGFRWDNGTQELTARWEDVVELRGSPVRDVVYGSIPLSTHYGHWVVLADGRECGFGGTLGATDSFASANESLHAIPGVTTAVTIEQLGRIFTARVTNVLPQGAGRFTYRATFTGSFLGLAPTGRPVVMHSIDIWRVVDGMAVEHWDQLDGQAFFAQLTGEDGGR